MAKVTETGDKADQTKATLGTAKTTLKTAQDKLQDLEDADSAVNADKVMLEQAQDAYNTAVENEKATKADLDAKQATLDEKQQTFDSAKTARDDAQAKYDAVTQKVDDALTAIATNTAAQQVAETALNQEAANKNAAEKQLAADQRDTDDAKAANDQLEKIASDAPDKYNAVDADPSHTPAQLEAAEDTLFATTDALSDASAHLQECDNKVAADNGEIGRATNALKEAQDKKDAAVAALAQAIADKDAGEQDQAEAAPIKAAADAAFTDAQNALNTATSNRDAAKAAHDPFGQAVDADKQAVDNAQLALDNSGNNGCQAGSRRCC